MFPPTSSVRKFVLEATNRALKDLPSSDSPETHYSRLLALSNLCHSLLTVRFNVNGKQVGEEIPTHSARVMLETHFLATLTNVLSEVDLNYLNTCNIVSSVLRPLKHLYVTHTLTILHIVYSMRSGRSCHTACMGRFQAG